jgi:cytochrome c5
VVSTSWLAAQQSPAPSRGKQADTHATRSASPAGPAISSEEGQRVFDRNCSRCHTAPDSFSPRITGTVVRHMRVRASLTAREEQELLRFFNP